MKIGIITFHRAINYGAVLQCYALQHAIMKDGHEVEIIDYRPESIEFYRNFFSWERHKRSGFNLIKSVLLSIYTWPTKVKANKNFDLFLDKYLNISKKQVSENNIESLNYDIIIIGSDQVLNTHITWGFDNVYWGNFNRGNAKLYTYAASTKNVLDYNKEDYNRINKLLLNFNGISVREHTFELFLKDKCSINSTTVLDPTLLLHSTDYDHLCKKPPIENYVFLYSLNVKSNAYSFAKQKAKELGCKLVSFSASKNRYDNTVITINGGTVFDFISYIKYSKLSIVCSFHGIVFSIINRIDFYCMESAGSARELNILQQLGLSSRLITSNHKCEYTSIDYSVIDEKLEILRRQSLLYLQSLYS